MSLLDTARRLRARSLTSEGLVRAACERADELDYLGCYISRFDEQAIAAAARADIELSAGTDRGALHGIPVAIKDIIASREGPTTAQSRVSDPGWQTGRDAPVIARLRSAGAIIIGKVTTMEYALGFPDPDAPYPLPRNPWNTDTWAGGSSSGCANGVAAGLFCAGIGTDTGGSIRVPAAFCGITGLLPTYGTVPMAGCLPLSYSLDRIGPMARTARDCAAVLEVLAGPAPAGGRAAPAGGRAASASLADHPILTSGSLAGLVIGVYLPSMSASTSASTSASKSASKSASDRSASDRSAVTACIESALSTLAELGASTVEIDLPYYQEIQAVDWMTVVSEAAACHRHNLVTRWQEYCPSTRLMIAEGLLIGAPDFVQAQRVRRVAQRRLASLFTRVDIVAMPTAFTPAPSFGDLFDSAPTDILAGLNTSYWNPVGNPVLALPIGFTAAGLPLSMQLAAVPFRDELALAVGALFQEATDWHSRLPVPSPPAADYHRRGVRTSAPGARRQRPPAAGKLAGSGAGLAGAGLAGAGLVQAAAELPASAAELRTLASRARVLREMRESLYRVAEADQEYPALAFSAEPPPAW